MLQNNPYKLISQVALAPDLQLVSMMEKYKNTGDAGAFSVVFNEVQRRKEVRDAAQSKRMGTPKQKVADQLIQEAKQAQMPPPPPGMGMPPQGGPPPGMPPQGMPPEMAMGPQGGPPPQGLPEQSGIGQLPAPNIANMAGGGLVSFAGDDNSFVLPNYYPDEGITSYAEQGGGVTAPETTTGAEEEEDEEDPYPRFDARDMAGAYQKDMDRLMEEQRREYNDYKTELNKFGSAYADAEARDKEFGQRYADEERVQKGIPWILAGARLMQSNAKGISGLGEAAETGIRASSEGREKLASLQDKQRDFMQTVKEARRAERRGDMDKLYTLRQSMLEQRANIAGVKAQLGLRQDEIGATLSAAMLRGQNGKYTPGNVVAHFQMLEEAALQRAQNPKLTPEERRQALQEAAYYNARAEQESPYLATTYGARPGPSLDALFGEFQKNNKASILAIQVGLKSEKESDRNTAMEKLKKLEAAAETQGLPAQRVRDLFGVGGGEGNQTMGVTDTNPLGLTLPGR